MPGLTGQLQYSFATAGFSSTTGAIASSTPGTEPATGDAGEAWSLNLGYTVGPFNAAIGYLYATDENNLTAGKQKGKALTALASWDFGFMKLTGYNNAESAPGPDYLDTWGGKIAVPLGNFVFTGGVSRTTDTTAVDGDDDDVWIYSLKGVYAMSKRTSLYAWYVYIDNDTAASKGIIATSAGESGQGVALGVRHAF